MTGSKAKDRRDASLNQRILGNLQLTATFTFFSSPNPYSAIITLFLCLWSLTIFRHYYKILGTAASAEEEGSESIPAWETLLGLAYTVMWLVVLISKMHDDAVDYPSQEFGVPIVALGSFALTLQLIHITALLRQKQKKYGAEAG